MKYKIGQTIKFTKAFTIDSSNGGKISVKAGDEARVVKKVDENTGEIVYISGDAKGKSQYIKIQVDDCIDGDSIAQRILGEIYK